MGRNIGKFSKAKASRRVKEWVYPKDPDAGRFRVPPSLSRPKRVFVCCRGCGGEVPDVPADGVCPKCGGHSWERYALSVHLLPKGHK